jgi:sulfur carrier protein
MRVTLDVAGGEVHELDAPEGTTWADLLGEVGLSPHEASVLVDGTPVPEDQSPETAEATVVRLVQGG